MGENSSCSGRTGFNFILAFLLALIVIRTAGFDRPEVKGVMEGYPAEEAGLQAGDIIKEINGKNIHIYREVSVYTLFHSMRTWK